MSERPKIVCQGWATVQEAYEYFRDNRAFTGIGDAMFDRLEAAATGREKWDERFNWVLIMVPGYPKWHEAGAFPAWRRSL